MTVTPEPWLATVRLAAASTLRWAASTLDPQPIPLTAAEQAERAACQARHPSTTHARIPRPRSGIEQEHHDQH